MNELAAAISKKKADEGLTFEDVANALGVKQPTASRWANGKSTPSADHLRAIAAWLDIDPDRALVMSRTSTTRDGHAKDFQRVLRSLADENPVEFVMDSMHFFRAALETMESFDSESVRNVAAWVQNNRDEAGAILGTEIARTISVHLEPEIPGLAKAVQDRLEERLAGPDGSN